MAEKEYNKDKIALCNIRKIIDRWSSIEDSLSARTQIDAELDKINI